MVLLRTLLPATMFFSGHGAYAPAREMIDAGCAIALASDLNPGSSLIYSMPLVMTIAALQMGLGPEECITASTINPAHALGIADMVGSLEPGKRADLLVLDIGDYRELAYHVGRDIVTDVIIRGRMVKQHGRMVLAGYSPIPYQAFTNTAGGMGMALLPFTLASFIGRGGRFFLVAFLMARFGPAAEARLKPAIEWLGWGTVALALVAYLLLR